MKAIQITMDENLLEELDSTPEVRREGRSAVIRRATAEYLHRSRREEIAEKYRSGYASGDLEDLDGWNEEGAWPEE